MTFAISRISNQMPIVTYHMPSFLTVSINYIVGVGSRYEAPSQEGLSHFLEHMAFKGTRSRTAAKIAQEFDEIGGQFNAYTSKEHTVYHAKVLDIHLEKALVILADIIMNSTYHDDEIKKEYGVICQEIAQTYDNPDDLCYENLVSSAFPNQPLGKSILGTEESIAKFTSASFFEFISEFYTSQNSLLSIAGNIKLANLGSLCERLFGHMPNNSSKKYASSYYSSGTECIQKDLEQTTLFLGFHSASYLDISAFYHTQMLSLIFGGGLSSRLFQSIREDQGLAYSVGSFNSSYADNGLFSLYASCNHDKLKQVLNSMIDQIHKVIDHVSDSEVSRAKNQIKSLLLMSEEKTGYKAYECGKNYLIFGREITVQEVLERVDAVSTSDIMGIASSIFSTNPSFSCASASVIDISAHDIKSKI